jgi:hypothetical protein
MGLLAIAVSFFFFFVLIIMYSAACGHDIYIQERNRLPLGLTGLQTGVPGLAALSRKFSVKRVNRKPQKTSSNPSVKVIPIST